MSTRQFGEKVQRREDPRLLTGNGRYLDDLGHTALAAAFVRSPHAHARVVDIDIGDAWEVDGVEAIYNWDDLTGRVAEPLPVLIPHPAMTHARTGYCLAKDEVVQVATVAGEQPGVLAALHLLAELAGAHRAASSS